MLGDHGTSYSFSCAVREGRLERVSEVISCYGLSYSQAWSDGYVLLRDAVANKHTEVAKLLLTNGSRVNSKKRKRKSTTDTPLHFAVVNGDIEIVRMLLDRGANTNAKNRCGITALHNTVKSKNMEIIELLVNQGAYVNTRNSDNITPLHLAAEKGCAEIIKLLLKHGADVNSVSTSKFREGYTPLFLAVKGGSEEVVTLLLESGANVNAQDKCGKSVLHFAVEKGQEKFVKLLLECGANVNAQTKNGITTLHAATQKGYVKVVEALLEYNADVNCTDKTDSTPLHIAAQKGHLTLVAVLLKFGASIDSEDGRGRTALYIACKAGHEQIVIALLEHGSDIKMSTYDHTPLDCVMAGAMYFYYLFNSYDTYDDDDYYIHDSDICVCEIIVHILDRHAIKMRTANLYVNKKNLKSICRPSIYSSGWDLDSLLECARDDKVKKECEEEIESMKSEKIGNSNVTFYDILTKGISELRRYAGNGSIVQILRSDNYQIKFPIYAGVINSNIRKWERRKELPEQGNKIFHFPSNNFPQLPPECTEEIFCYLSDEDLRRLIDACKPMSVSSPNTDINNVAITSNISKIP